MSNIPDFMPVLAQGGHGGPKDGACVMEYISLLAGEEWTDNPDCTHPLISSVARHVNDRLCDEHRPLLVPLIPRLMGTSTLTRQTEEPLYQWLMRQGPVMVGRCTIGFTSPSDIISYAMQPRGFGGAECQAGVDLLTSLLDEYDRLSGRTEYAEVTETDLRRLAEVVRQ